MQNRYDAVANGSLVGLDNSLGILDQARQRVKHKCWTNVVLGLGDAAQLPFADATSDRVLCTYALKAIPFYRQALDEVQRVLKPEGVFVVMDAALSDGLTRFLNPLIRWLTHSFFYDVPRLLTDEITRRFQDVHTTPIDLGHTLVIVVRKI